MTTDTTATSRFDQKSVIGISASVAAAIAVGLLCTLIEAPPPVAGALVAGATGLPAAIEYSLRGRHRNTTDDIARIRQGELRRPVGLVVVMLIAALFLIEMAVSVAPAIPGLNYEGFVFFSGCIAAAIAFFPSSYASHYLGNHPYRWTVVAVTAVFIGQLLFEFLMAQVFVPSEGMSAAFLLWSSLYFPYYVMVLAGSLAGAWYGRRHHDEFLSRKLVRLEQNASRAAAPEQPLTLSDAAPARAHQVPNATAAEQPPPRSGSDPIEQLRKLGELRDARVLTDEEFQAKKAEILGRI
jgi:hypothetical protein